MEVDSELLSESVSTIAGDRQSDGTMIMTVLEKEYDVDTDIQLKAVPSDGYYFVHWTGDIPDESLDYQNEVTIPITCNKEVTAVFAPYTYNLRISIAPSDGGQVNIIPSRPEGGYVTGTRVTLKAITNPGYIFEGWSGAIAGENPSIDVIMDNDKEIIANFLKESTFSLSWPHWLGIIAVSILVIISVLFLLFRFSSRRQIPH